MGAGGEAVAVPTQGINQLRVCSLRQAPEPQNSESRGGSARYVRGEEAHETIKRRLFRNHFLVLGVLGDELNFPVSHF